VLVVIFIQKSVFAKPVNGIEYLINGYRGKFFVDSGNAQTDKEERKIWVDNDKMKNFQKKFMVGEQFDNSSPRFPLFSMKKKQPKYTGRLATPPF
jgi:hypothetical protein